jgi:hypothetical protein
MQKCSIKAAASPSGNKLARRITVGQPNLLLQ